MQILSVIDTISRWFAGLGALLVCGIAALIIAEVVARSTFGASLSFAWEYAAYFYASAVFLGAAYTMRTGGHVRVALLRGLLSKRGQHIMEIAATAVGTLFSFYLAYALIQFAYRSFSRGSTSPTIDETPLVIPQGVLALGATLLALQMVARLVRLFIDEAPEDDATREKFTVE
ncbi:TRAP transporter small permease subunit [Roseibium sp. MMSF_3544]|uniref:TRAP transporter small permease subunit n=1 Tax=unclassified Roseibium TaxID=2629323 RepID=UPI00273D34A0|nr:TRAP transporter small permease [Roseibium sp. MMSF_3544]